MLVTIFSLISSTLYSVCNRELKQRRRRKKDVKKEKGLLSKTTTLHMMTLFCRYLHRPCTTTTWKCLIASFMKDVNKRRPISFSLSKLDCGPQEINSKEIRLHSPFSANWNKRDKDWKSGNSFSNWRFRCRYRRRCLSSLLSKAAEPGLESRTQFAINLVLTVKFKGLQYLYPLVQAPVQRSAY